MRFPSGGFAALILIAGMKTAGALTVEEVVGYVSANLDRIGTYRADASIINCG